MKGFKLDDTGDVFINNLDKVPKEPLVFEGATTQEVIEQGKNLLDIKTFSANDSLTNPALRNNYGTTLSTIDGTLNSVTITQVPSGTNTDFTNYINGYFNIGLENITPKRNYTISFDYEIISNPLNATKFFLMPNGTGNSCYADAEAASGRTSANFYFADVAGKKYIELRLGGCSCTISNFMVTEVGQSTEFEPYIAPSPTITNPSPLISLIHNETKTGYGVALNGIGAAKDVLTINDKIVKMKDAGSISADGFLSEAEMINGEGLLLTPGFIDSHVHVLGGGGEGGFANRTPEATIEGLTKFGVTTVVGCLGTDGIGRDMCALVAKTKGLNEQGMSAYCYTGSYQIPVRTLTDSIVKDIMMIQEIVGTGEIAISDHRSSQPTFEEFARVVADTRLGGVLSGKAGIVNVHLGDSPRCLDLIERVVDETEIPASQILPTHINRNEMLFCKSIEYALKGGAVDFTGNEDIDYWETICDEVRVCNGIKRMLDAGVNPDRMTISSDGQGSLPMYSSDGEFLGMGVGQSSCLLKEVKECVFKTKIPLEIAISTITSNPAEILRLKGKGKIEEGYDADLCILDQELQLVEVIAKGNTLYKK